MNFISLIWILVVLGVSGCAHKAPVPVSEEEAARLNRSLVREAVVFEPGSEQGAIVPDVSSPRLRAKWIEERRENNHLIEAHREWFLEGDVVLLAIPKPPQATPQPQQPQPQPGPGVRREN